MLCGGGAGLEHFRFFGRCPGLPQNCNSAPGSRTQPRPQTFLGNRWQLVVGDLWLTDFPEKRSQKARREPLPRGRPVGSPYRCWNTSCASITAPQNSVGAAARRDWAGSVASGGARRITKATISLNDALFCICISKNYAPERITKVAISLNDICFAFATVKTMPRRENH